MKRVSLELQGVWVCDACDCEQADLLEKSTGRGRVVWKVKPVLTCRFCGEESRADVVMHTVSTSEE